jgi:hypothetical protein
LKKKGKVDKEILDETEKSFLKLKNIFEKDGIKKINNELILCLKPFQNKDKLDIINELAVLAEIFKIKESKNSNEVQNDLLLILKKEYIYNIALSIAKFNSVINPKSTEFSEDIEYIQNNLKLNNDISIIGKSKELLNKYDIDVDGKENEYLDILINMKEKIITVLYLFKTTIEDCYNLQELASNNDNNYINVNDILELQKCIEFFHNLGKLDELKEKTDIDILFLLKQNTEKNKDILFYIKNYLVNFNQIKMLKSSLNQSEVLKYKVQSLFNGTLFQLSSNKDQLFKCSYFDNKEEKEKQNLNKEDLISLRERAQLSKNITSDYKCFIDKALEIINITNILEEISKKGYPKNIVIIIKLNITINNKNNQIEIYDNSEYYSIINIKNTTNYKEIIEKLNNILSNLKAKQIIAYKKNPLVRYIFGPQFNLLNNFFIKNGNKDINPFLKYVTNDLYKEKIDDYTIENKGDIIENNINDCNNYLSEILKINNITLKDIYENTIINQKNKKENYQGVYIYLC